jgi:ATP phosphoribosyltransferase regulatory subunit
MLALALEATSAFGLNDVEIRTGDVALFNALIDALDLYPVWRRRLIKDFNRKVSLTHDIERLTLATGPGRNEYEGVLAALAGSDRQAALALVTDLMSIAGTTNVGGRTVDEIADRFLEQSTLKSGVLPGDTVATIKRFLAIAGDPDDAVAQLRALADDTKLNITAAIDQLERLHGRTRRRHPPDALFDLIRTRPRLLHRLRVRTARQRQWHRAAGGGRAL